jgi:threonine/homoserine/homoserine lactone efflux protein
VIPLETLAVFFAAAVALAAAPGPDNLFVLTQSALHGRTAGVLVTVGLCAGLMVHTAAVALGVAAMLQAAPLAFRALTLAGAAYLLWLAWGAVRAGPAAVAPAGPAAGTSAPDAAPRAGTLALVRRGVLMNVTNPKVAIFFLAFLPPFTDPARGPVALQVLLLGAVFMVAAFSVFGTVAWAAGFLGGWLRRTPRAQVVMNRVAALVFVALALRLLWAGA